MFIIWLLYIKKKKKSVCLQARSETRNAERENIELTVQRRFFLLFLPVHLSFSRRVIVAKPWHLGQQHRRLTTWHQSGGGVGGGGDFSRTFPTWWIFADGRQRRAIRQPNVCDIFFFRQQRSCSTSDYQMHYSAVNISCAICISLLFPPPRVVFRGFVSFIFFSFSPARFFRSCRGSWTKQSWPRKDNISISKSINRTKVEINKV